MSWTSSLKTCAHKYKHISVECNGWTLPLNKISTYTFYDTHKIGIKYRILMNKKSLNKDMMTINVYFLSDLHVLSEAHQWPSD